MKKIFLLGFISLFMLMAGQKAFAQCTVYIYFDHVMGWPVLPFKVNGEHAFDLKPDRWTKFGTNSGTPVYQKVLRKVIFNTPDHYVISFDGVWAGKPYHVETMINLEDGETYYIEFDWKINGPTFKEVPAKQGLKFLKKAQKRKDITINPDFVYGN